MPPYVDPHGRGRIATIALALYALVQLGEMATTWLAPGDEIAGGIAAIAVFVTLVAAVVATAFWIHRVNANAQSFTEGGLAISPGWNVGWFFVPIANLWKPFEGVKETWQASADPADWPGMPVPSLLYAWWACWVIGNLLSNVSLRMAKTIADPTLTAIDLAASALLIVAAVLLIRIIAQLSHMQPRAHAAHAFA